MSNVRRLFDYPFVTFVGWAGVSQVISSLTNFAYTIAVSRHSTGATFGIFSIGFSVYLIFLGISRALVFEPLLIRSSASNGPAFRPKESSSAVFALSFIATTAYLLLAVSLTAMSDRWILLIPAAVALPGQLFHDLRRYQSLASMRPQRAVKLDSAWLVMAIVALILGEFLQSPTPGLLAWMAGPVIAIVLFDGVDCLSIKWGSGVAWLRSNRDLGLPFLGEFTATSGASQIGVQVLALTAGVLAVGGLKGAQVLYGPVALIITGTNFVGIRPTRIRLEKKPNQAGHLGLLVTFALVGLAALWFLVVIVTSPHLARFVLGASVASVASPAIPFVGVYMIAQASWMGPVLLLRALEEPSPSLRVRVLLAPAIVGALGLGGAIAGLSGAAIALAVVGWTGTVLWWRAVRRVL